MLKILFGFILGAALCYVGVSGYIVQTTDQILFERGCIR